MHTAMRPALTAGRRVRREHPALAICFYGLYATASRELIEHELTARAIAGEERLVGCVEASHRRTGTRPGP